jgi:hypothetical protein
MSFSDSSRSATGPTARATAARPGDAAAASWDHVRESCVSSEALLASRSTITGPLDVLERLHAIQRSRAAGERMDRVRTDFSSAEARGFEITEYQELGDLAQEGLEVLSDAPPQRRADLLELAAFADLLVEGTQTLRQQWEARRDALRASGELPS